MATVYSLVCWGGRTGKTVSISASTDVVTLTNHGLRNGTKLWPSGTLPAELNTSTPVYARSTATGAFTLHTSAAGAIAGTGQITFAGTSTYAAVVLKSDLVVSPSTALSAYGQSDLSRWGASGSERIYDGLASWYAARNPATTAYDMEVCEVGEAFLDYGSTSGQKINMICAKTQIEPTINGTKTTAWHGGVFGQGYVFISRLDYGIGLTLDGTRIVLRDVSIGVSSGGNKHAVSTGGVFNEISGCFIYGSVDASGTNRGHGVNLAGSANRLLNNVILASDRGIQPANYYGTGNLCAYNTVVGNNTGFYAGDGTSVGGWFYCNVAVGNTTNWASGMPSSANGMGFNAGATGDTVWYKTTNTSIYGVTTADFVDYAGKDFRPTSASVLVDSGFYVFDSVFSDIAGGERPNYNNGGAEEYDIGAFEYDHGYGPHPASYDLTITGLKAGVEVRCYIGARDGTATEVAGVENLSGTSFSFSHNVGGQSGFILVVSTGYKLIDLDYTYQSSDATLPLQLVADQWYSNPA